MERLETPSNYRKSTTYQKGSQETRRLIECYQKEQNISEEQMAWLMYLEDLRALPKEEIQKGNHMAEGMVIGAMVLFLAVMQSRNKGLLLLASVLVIAMGAVYLTGLLNPYTDTLRRVKRTLKKQYPEVTSYQTWLKEQAGGTHSASSSKHSL